MKVGFVFAALLLSATSLPAQPASPQKIDPVKEADIRRLLEITGTKKLIEQMMATAQDQLRSTLEKELRPSDRAQRITDTFFQKFRARFNAELLIEQVLPLYDKYFPAEDIQGLIRFYETPLGQRAVKALPEISRESQRIGYQIGQKAAQDVLQEMQQEYPELRPEPKPPAP